ncbi:MAG TPA: crotonase/enoyl-CoA hydratase family protein [Kofleriaceae bacterium]|nr:crotonase/enoyl-CoA hydratase family protein [Kofleriaceae bacterium]
MDIVSYRLESSLATITMDDGKVNALSLTMQSQLQRALDRAQDDRAAVVLTGRPGVFSAGFDLRVIQAGGPEAATMVRGGFELAERLLAFPAPVVIACPGHAIAMAAFVLLSVDYRVGAAGAFKLTANEVAIGLTMPHAAIEICRQRLTPSHFHRAVVLAEVFSPEDAISAGFLDRVVLPGELAQAARGAAEALASLHRAAHVATKLRTREHTLRAIRAAIEADAAAFAGR